MKFIPADSISKACSPFAKTDDLINLLSFKMSFFDFLNSISKSKILKSIKKDLLKKYQNYEYYEIMYTVLSHILNKDLFPIYDSCEASTVDEMEGYLASVPLVSCGYYGSYSGGMDPNDLTDRTDYEKSAALIFMWDNFFAMSETPHELLESISDDEIKNKIKNYVANYSLENIYKYFRQDIKGNQYKDDSFMKNFVYLVNRLSMNTGCPFLDTTPEEADQEPHAWEDIDGWALCWKEAKPKEKALWSFIRRLESSKRMSKRFYKTLFEIAYKYAEPKKTEQRIKITC